MGGSVFKTWWFQLGVSQGRGGYVTYLAQTQQYLVS